MMKLKALIQATALALSLATLGAIPAFAHGDDKPQHGGIMQVANDVSFELVPEADGATLYLMDHGKPLATKGMSGKLTVLQGSTKKEADLKEASDNKLRAFGITIGKGDKLVASVSNVGGKRVAVRFTVR